MAGGTKNSTKEQIQIEEGNHDAEAGRSTLVNNDIPYIQPRHGGASPQRVSKRKYTVPTPHLPQVVTIEGISVGRVNELKLADHDFHDKKKFHNFMSQYYMNSTMVEQRRRPIFNYQKCALGLELSGINNLLDILYFCHSMYIMNCVKTLLSYVHVGYLWLDPPVSIDVELINKITGLPMVGEDPTPLFADKRIDKIVAAQVAAQYKLDRGSRGLLVAEIKEKATHFGIQLMAGKLLRHE